MSHARVLETIRDFSEDGYRPPTPAYGTLVAGKKINNNNQNKFLIAILCPVKSPRGKIPGTRTLSVAPCRPVVPQFRAFWDEFKKTTSQCICVRAHIVIELSTVKFYTPETHPHIHIFFSVYFSSIFEVLNTVTSESWNKNYLQAAFFMKKLKRISLLCAATCINIF